MPKLSFELVFYDEDIEERKRVPNFSEHRIDLRDISRQRFVR